MPQASCVRSRPSNNGQSRHTYAKGLFQYVIPTWVARQGRPFSIIEDPELMEAFRMLDNKVELHSHQTVARDIQDVYILLMATSDCPSSAGSQLQVLNSHWA